MPWILLLEKIDIKRLKRDANPRPLVANKGKFIIGLCQATSCAWHPVRQQEVYKHEAP